jgi:hypothetical protein
LRGLATVIPFFLYFHKVFTLFLPFKLLFQQLSVLLKSFLVFLLDEVGKKVLLALPESQQVFVLLEN